ncbi:ABC transporter substrate-binding protein [Harryflintia acetispora]|uniref:ABC transporter substrate-binding protein n=1 Tax=Harryflintia acetispora TaxID=1849041 RepID=UPI00189B4040|nr:ABC transporter substrate-binding protein [Harryflintia acetispora]
MKRIFLLFLSVLLLLCGCGGREENALRLGVMYSADILPLALMKEQGMDQAHGFTLDMQVFSSAKDRDAALQAGELDGVFTDYIGVCIYQNAGLDVRITGVTDGDYLLLAAPGSGIGSLAGAAGQRVAISQNTLIEYALEYILGEEGYPPDYLKKELVPRIPDRLQMLRENKVELVLLPEPFSTLALQEGATALGSANTSHLYPAVSAFTGTALEKKGGEITRFYEAYDEAAGQLNALPAGEIDPALLEAAGFPKEAGVPATLPHYRPSALPSREDLQRAIGWAAERGLCSGDLSPDALLGSPR